MHLAIAGNIGSGKTTLTRLLAQHYKITPHYESVDDNPYLNDFYKDMQRWSFNLQVYFLNSRFQQLVELRESGQKIIQDRTIYEDAYIFAPNLHAMGLMTTRDFENYISLFETMQKLVAPPDLLIYLRASVPTLVDHTDSRCAAPACMCPSRRRSPPIIISVCIMFSDLSCYTHNSARGM